MALKCCAQRAEVVDQPMRQVGEWIRVVAVNKQCASKPVSIKVTIWAKIVLNQPLSTLNTDLRTFIRSGK